MQIIEVFGKASLRSWKLRPKLKDLEKTLLDYLREQGFSVASSCSGQKKCRKCVFNEHKLSCEETVSESLGKKIYFDYM